MTAQRPYSDCTTGDCLTWSEWIYYRQLAAKMVWPGTLLVQFTKVLGKPRPGRRDEMNWSSGIRSVPWDLLGQVGTVTTARLTAPVCAGVGPPLAPCRGGGAHRPPLGPPLGPPPLPQQLRVEVGVTLGVLAAKRRVRWEIQSKGFVCEDIFTKPLGLEPSSGEMIFFPSLDLRWNSD